MGWSIRLFDVAGTAVRIHLTFFLLLAWIGAIHYTRGGTAAAVDGVLFIVLLFVCVVGDEVLDTSVKARLEQMKVALTA
jgi:Zn-dependent protease